ncbi:hypothetical protein Avbf_12466 [Armadillidium vulgare]|nr:hypothetical protein Avbf_12466 [Armadillidium vulgare]
MLNIKWQSLNLIVWQMSNCIRGSETLFQNCIFDSLLEILVSNSKVCMNFNAGNEIQESYENYGDGE